MHNKEKTKPKRSSGEKTKNCKNTTSSSVPKNIVTTIVNNIHTWARPHTFPRNKATLCNIIYSDKEISDTITQFQTELLHHFGATRSRVTLPDSVSAASVLRSSVGVEMNEENDAYKIITTNLVGNVIASHVQKSAKRTDMRTCPGHVRDKCRPHGAHQRAQDRDRTCPGHKRACILFGDSDHTICSS